MHSEVIAIQETHAVHQIDRFPAIIVLSSSLVVLYANRGGMAVLSDLKGTKEEASVLTPAPVLAYLADGILKKIDVRRMSRVYTPFSISCSIQGPAKIWHCQAFGLHSHEEIDRSRIVLLFSDNPPHARSTERKRHVPTSSSPLPLLGVPDLEASVT